MSTLSTAAAAGDAPSPPPKLAPVWASLWAVGGVCALLLMSVVRLFKFVAGMAEANPTVLHGVFAVCWIAFMLWSESWKGFHLRLSPRLVKRARELPMDRPLVVLFAPLVCMGFFYASRRRLIGSWVLLAAIIVLVFFIRQLSQPWRGLVDLGVVAGLTAGVTSIIYCAVRDWNQPADVSADWPESPAAVTNRD